jgi:hypothetical protein
MIIVFILKDIKILIGISFNYLIKKNFLKKFYKKIINFI